MVILSDVDLALEGDLLGGGHLALAAEASLLEDGDLQRSLGGKDAVVVAVGDAQDAVVAVEGERREAFVLHRLLRALRDLELRVEAEQVLAPLVGQGACLVERHLGQLGVGNRVGEGQLLFGGQADEAVERDLVLGEGVLGAHQGLLLGLELHAGAQHVEVGADAGVVGERGLAQHLFVRR